MDKDYRERVREEAAEETVPRRMFIYKRDVEEHGYTTRCPGCVSILRGTARQEHTAECRRRLEKELGMTERAKRAKKKVGEYVEKKMEEDEEVRRKKEEQRRRDERRADESEKSATRERPPRRRARRGKGGGK